MLHTEIAFVYLSFMLATIATVESLCANDNFTDKYGKRTKTFNAQPVGSYTITYSGGSEIPADLCELGLYRLTFKNFRGTIKGSFVSTYLTMGLKDHKSLTYLEFIDSVNVSIEKNIFSDGLIKNLVFRNISLRINSRAFTSYGGSDPCVTSCSKADEIKFQNFRILYSGNQLFSDARLKKITFIDGYIDTIMTSFLDRVDHVDVITMTNVHVRRLRNRVFGKPSGASFRLELRNITFDNVGYGTIPIARRPVDTSGSVTYVDIKVPCSCDHEYKFHLIDWLPSDKRLASVLSEFWCTSPKSLLGVRVKEVGKGGNETLRQKLCRRELDTDCAVFYATRVW